MAKTKVKATKVNSNKKRPQSDFYLVLLWISVIGALSYFFVLHPSFISETFGSVPSGWHAYWIISGLLFTSGLVATFKRKLDGVKIMLAVSLSDAVLPPLIFSQLRAPSHLTDSVFNLSFVTLWLLFIKLNPKFLTK